MTRQQELDTSPPTVRLAALELDLAGLDADIAEARESSDGDGWRLLRYACRCLELDLLERQGETSPEALGWQRWKPIGRLLGGRAARCAAR